MERDCRRSNRACRVYRGCSWRVTPIPASEFRIAFVWAGRQPPALSLPLDHDAHAGGLNFDAVDVEIEIERLIDLHVGIARLNDMLDEGIQNRPVPPTSQKLHKSEEDGSASVGRFDANRYFERALAFDQPGDEGVDLLPFVFADLC